MFAALDTQEGSFDFLLMSRALTPFYKRIIQRQIATGRFSSEDEVIRHSLRLVDALEQVRGPAGTSFRDRDELEALLLEGLDAGESARMNQSRKKRIYQRALEEE